MTAPIEDRDLAWHFKTPFCCTLCTSSLLSAEPDALVLLGTWLLVDAGRAVCFQPLVGGILLPVLSLGRSPPVTV